MHKNVRNLGHTEYLQNCIWFQWISGRFFFIWKSIRKIFFFCYFAVCLSVIFRITQAIEYSCNATLFLRNLDNDNIYSVQINALVLHSKDCNPNHISVITSLISYSSWFWCFFVPDESAFELGHFDHIK